ncbi:large-conductance mechanosensitive channel protein MscL [Jatrophihabitans endophyticus]|uniref:large-conductance mechanosensitive channel protein MscL n=1 Tax=Jatrophihabitans endophyticus TaxID=1206085 RepID=UPI0019E14B94|nr:large-conductance mechanosensitive channel protein MscL [Jatrophihabitans endophyticus]MBE7188542.1 large-conductance mechanosensitive channel protein MscL [Jatrophihabitans endophyticus]
MLKGFKEFIMRGNVVDLAIAVVIGAAFTAVVTAFVADIITPLIAAIGGQPSFEGLTFTINKSTFQYGLLINAIISFLIVAAVIYFLIVLPLNKIAERRAARMATGEPDPTPKAEDILLLEQIRDLLAGSAGDLPTATTGTAVSTDKPSPGPTA